MDKKSKFKTKKGFIKGEKKMTENAIKYQSLQEDKRHNVEEERRKEKERKADVFSKIGSGIGSGIGGALGAINDPSWYNLDKQMVKDTAQVSFNTPLGATVTLPFQKTQIPGIMSLFYAPTIGDSDAANSAAKNIYAFIRQANSGAKNYEPNDIMAYLLAMGDAYAFHAYLCRLYSLTLTAKGHNKYYYDALITACGGVPSDLRNNIAQLRAFINSYAQRLNAFYVPKDLSLFARRYWMNINIFKDQGIKKSQEYVFRPYCLGIYDDTASAVSMLGYDDWGTVGTGFLAGTYDALKFTGDYIVNNLLSSTDIAIMSGDILKAYGESNVHYINSINDDFHVEAIYSPEVLSQIHNATIIGELKGGDSRYSSHMFDIQCPAGGTICQGVAPSSGSALGRIYGRIRHKTANHGYLDEFGCVVNMYKDDPTPDDVMVATRLTVGFNTSGIDSSSATRYWAGTSTAVTMSSITNPMLQVEAHGSEVIVIAFIYTLDSAGAVSAYNIGTSLIAVKFDDTFSNITSGVFNQMKDQMDLLKLIFKFDWAPVIYFIDDKTSLTSSDYCLTYLNTMDAANTASVATSTLKNMHYTAILSEYGVPKLGYKVRS